MTVTFDTPEMRASVMDRQQHRASVVQRLMSFGGKQAGNDEIVILDMSYWQDHNKIDYDLLSENIDGVILRGTYGIWKDTRFDIHYDNFHKRKVPLGSYAYLIGNKTGQEQANAFYEAVGNRKLSLGIWSDIEDRRPGTALSRYVADKFMGYADYMFETTADVYTGPYAWQAIMKTGGHSHRKLWIGNYLVNTPALPVGGDWTTWWLWQYTDRGRHAGYGSGLDTNKFNGTNNEYWAWTSSETPDPITDKEKLNIVYNWYEKYHKQLEGMVK